MEQVAAYNWRAEREWERSAWMVQRTGMWGNSVPTIDELLGREPQMTLDEKLAAWAELLEDDRLKSGKGQDA